MTLGQVVLDARDFFGAAVDVIPVGSGVASDPPALADARDFFGAEVDALPRIAGFRVPTDIGGLRLWLEADAIINLYDGDPVGTWVDASGQGNHAVQATASKKPVYKANIINGNPVVRFDGTDDFLQTALFASPLAQPNTLVVVAKVKTDIETYQFVDGGTGARNILYRESVSAKFTMHADVDLGGALSDTSWHVHTCVFNGVSSSIFMDGTSRGTGDAGSQSMSRAMIGSHVNGTSSFLDGDIAAVLIYSGSLSTADRLHVERYLQDKYAL